MWKDDRVIAIGDNAVLRLDSTGRIEKEISKEGFKCSPNAIATSRNVICIATSDKAKIVFVSESQSYKVSVPELITALALSRDGEILYAGSNTGRLFIWQIKTGALVKSQQIFFNSITDAKVDFANSTLLLSSKNGDLSLINLVKFFSSGENKGTLYLGHSTSVTSIANLMQGPFSRSLSFVSVSQDKNIRFWYHEKPVSTSSRFLEHTPLLIVPSLIGDRLYIPCEMGHIAVVPLMNFEGTFLLSGHIGSVTGCVEAQNLVTCALDGVRIWDVDRKLCLSHYSSIGPRITKMISDITLADATKFVPLRNVTADEPLATITLK